MFISLSYCPAEIETFQRSGRQTSAYTKLVVSLKLRIYMCRFFDPSHSSQTCELKRKSFAASSLLKDYRTSMPATRLDAEEAELTG